jgi:hypothetical protein
VISYQVISWFQSLAFKCNLCRYIAVRGTALAHVVGLYKLNAADP